jgi:hypothetical protein
MIVDAAVEVYNFDTALIQSFVEFNFGALGVEVLDLEDLNAPEITEFRGSMTRGDAESGDSLSIQPHMIDALLADSKSPLYLDPTSMGATRVRIEAMENPPLSASDSMMDTFASALVLAINPADLDWGTVANSSLRARKDWVNVWLREERLATNLGWRTPGHRFTSTEHFEIADKIEAAKQVLTA